MKQKDASGLVWMDLEMTGLDPEKDRILEVAVIATDWQLKELGRLKAVIKVPEAILAKRMVGEFWEKNEASCKALKKQNQLGEGASIVEKKLLDFIQKFFQDETVYLAGNSIHQDRRFISREWPKLDRRLHYRMLDVSAWKIYFEHVLGVHFVKPEAHRALDDIKGSIAELKFYREKLK